jgi:hypothetical protein
MYREPLDVRAGGTWVPLCYTSVVVSRLADIALLETVYEIIKKV